MTLINARCRSCGRVLGHDDRTCYACETRDHTLHDLTREDLIAAVAWQAEHCEWHTPPVACLATGCGRFGQSAIASVLVDGEPRCHAHATVEQRRAFEDEVTEVLFNRGVLPESLTEASEYGS